MIRIVVVMLCLWVVAASAVCAGNDAPPIAERTDSTYVALAREYMGFDQAKDLASEPQSTTVEVITASETSTPFQTEVFAGKRVWHVRFESVQLALDRTERGGKVADPRDFDVYFDSTAGDLLRIISRVADYDLRSVDKPCRFDPELCYSENKMVDGEQTTEIAVGFVSALNVVLGVDATDAAEVIGRYAWYYSGPTRELHPAWFVNLIGLPASIGAFGNEDLMREQLTHEDCLIDALEGQCFSCGMPPIVKWDDPAKAEAAGKPRTNARARQYQAAAKAAEDRAKEKEQAEQVKPE